MANEVIDKRRLELVLKDSLERSCLVPELIEEISYSLLGGGKRLRPLLALNLYQDLCSKILDKDDSFFRVTLALELLHVSSLIHDDLPALDNDDFRRGKVSNHKQFGEGAALLAGDALVGLGFSWIAEAETVSAEHKVTLMKILAEVFCKLCSGQRLDIVPGNVESRKRIQIDTLKTGALFGGAFAFGAILAGKKSTFIEYAIALGNHFGLLFQAVDDVEDVYSNCDEEKMFAESKVEELKKSFRSELERLERTESVILGNVRELLKPYC